MKRSSLWTIGIVFCCLGIAVSFQNCGKAGLEATSITSASLDPDAKTVPALSADFRGLPFPFDAKINQIGYLSCGNPRLFTFRVGAFDASEIPTLGQTSAGITLRTQFLSGFDNKAKKFAPALRTAKFEEVMRHPATHLDSQLALSFRAMDNYDQSTPAYTLGNNKVFERSLLQSLDSENILSAFIKNRQASFSFLNRRATIPGQSSIRADFAVNKGQTAIDYTNFTQDFCSAGDFCSLGQNPIELVLGFSKSEDFTKGLGLSPILNAPNDSSKRLARSYKLGFQNPDSIRSPRTLAGVEETDQQVGLIDDSSQWKCSDFRFRVVKESDRLNILPSGRAVCPKEPAQAFDKNPAAVDAIKAIRRFLPSDQWDINLTEKCVVQYSDRSPSCYDGLDAAIVSYDPRDRDCVSGFLGNPQQGNLKVCPHYFSMCIRTPK